MSKLALGIIETVGLAAAIEAADVAMKSANVKLIGYELTKGDGMATIKVEGSVGAVKAAIDAAVTSASKVNKIWGKRVIPRPGAGVEILIYSDETVGLEKNQKDIKDQEKQEEVSVYNMQDDQKLIDQDQQDVETDEDEVYEDQEDIEINEDENNVQSSDGCNLCKDPACPRRKGDLKKMCIHYKEFKKERRFYK
ncbi:BMC domain-containing protein [Marinisporobacter balticus]|uniref:BMC domain-containing protein n=1 Tax=Marinisporobacter balticus TaxID=2018667 RepID=A0A4R2KU77_9FIRM|nr:BMC domain-containing protein [Marinisporobacter balticus]TCO77961.1 BMC domain-containing protein [Marinisporobacter balticus]